MIMTINSTYKLALEQVEKNEHRLDSMVVSKLRDLARDMSQNDDMDGLVELNNTLVKLDNVIKKAYVTGDKAEF
jgi:hypothetical protein